MDLVQLVISCLMYGNGCSKQVLYIMYSIMLLHRNVDNFQMYNSFQPLMICLSYTGMHAQMKCLAKDFDKKALKWVENLARTAQV